MPFANATSNRGWLPGLDMKDIAEVKGLRRDGQDSGRDLESDNVSLLMPQPVPIRSSRLVMGGSVAHEEKGHYAGIQKQGRSICRGAGCVTLQRNDPGSMQASGGRGFVLGGTGRGGPGVCLAAALLAVPLWQEPWQQKVSSLVPYEDFEQPPPSERGDQLLRLPTLEDVWQSLEAQEPLAPPMQLPPKVVAQFLEAQLHLGQVALDEADPLLPHLAHSAGPSGRPSVQLSQLLLIFLARGHHALPYLWRRAVAGAVPPELTGNARNRLPGEALGPMVEAFTTHLELLRPLVSDEILDSAAFTSQRAVGLTSSQLHQVAVMVPKLFRSQGALEFPRQQQQLLGPAHSDLQRAMEYAGVQALRRIHGEMMLRQDESDDANGLSSLAEIRSFAWLNSVSRTSQAAMLRISLIILGLGAAQCEDCEEMQMLQAERPLQSLQMKTMKDTCGSPVPWPCDNSVIAAFPLQVINSDDCKNDPHSTIFRLDLSPGTAGSYTPLCRIPEYCLNACGIDPDTSHIFCSQRPEGSENLVRVDCDNIETDIEQKLAAGTLTSTNVPVAGSLCFFGKLQKTFAANFDIDGNFWFKESIFNNDNDGKIFRITDNTFANLGAGSTDSSTTFVTGGETPLLTRNDLGEVDDLNVITLDLGNGDQKYVTGCFGNKVAFQQVTVTPPGTIQPGVGGSPQPIILTMVGENPGQGPDPDDDSSGAQWLFDGKVFCAYNDGTSGVIEILLDTINLGAGTIDAKRVSDSDETNSNDGLNCLKAPPPFEGGEDGDPHIQTLDGEHYLLLSQGSFSFWNFSGVDAQISQTKRVPVNFQIFTHYSGHSSYTKGLLLLDSTGQGENPGHTLEVTAEDCRWRTKSDASWRLVEGPELLTLRDAEGDAMTAFNMTTSSAGQQMHAELLMKTMQGFRKIGNVYAVCKPRHHINVKISMFSKQDLLLVQGQLGHHAESSPRLQPVSLLQGQKLSLDQDLKTSKTWEELGGSLRASAYLKQVDEEGVAVLKGCAEEEKNEAKATCTKFLGRPDPNEIGKDRAQFFANIFEDCVFDVCAGGDQTAAELAAEYLNGF
eukprot:s631_g23.t1